LRKLFSLAGALVALAVPAGAHAADAGINVPGGEASAAQATNIPLGSKMGRVFWTWNGQSTPGGELANYVSIAAAFNARGAKPVFTLTGHGGGSGIDINAYANYIGLASQALGTNVAAWEVWNEPDEAEYWGNAGGDPAKYTALLKAVYPKVAGRAPVFVGGLVGNDYDFVDKLYAAGAKGSFDGIATHTDTACSIVGPDQFYRDPNGRISRYSFLGFREVKASMDKNGDGDKPIWITEMGWNTMSTAPTSCDLGDSAGKKAAGVSQPDQAKFLQQAYACLEGYPYVRNALWFNLQDSVGNGSAHFYGLLEANGVQKPSYGAYTGVLGGVNPFRGQECGDFDPPTITVNIPANTQFTGALPLRASAADKAGVGRISYFVDDSPTVIRNFTPADKVNLPTTLEANLEANGGWQGAKKLAPGPHVIKVVALDKQGNTATATVTVVKIDAGQVAAVPTTLVTTLSGKGATKTLTVKVQGSGLTTLTGKINVAFEKKVKGKWKKAHGFSSSAKSGFKKSKTLKKAQWRVRIDYTGGPGYKKSSKTISFKV
jgi:hypothetical protein